MTRVHVTDFGAGARRRLLASSEGVLVLHERRRLMRGGLPAWCIVGCHLVTPDEVPRCALDVREAYAAAALPYIAPLRDVGSTTPTREMVRP